MQQNPYQAPVGGPPGMAGAGAGLSTGQYEFGPAEDQIIRQAGSRASTWGIISLVIGVLSLILGGIAVAFTSSLPGPLAMLGPGIGAVMLPVAITNLVGAYFYYQAGESLKTVADTQGNDVEHMMQGLNKLANAFMIEGIMLVLSLVLGFALGVVLAGSGMAEGL